MQPKLSPLEGDSSPEVTKMPLDRTRSSETRLRDPAHKVAPDRTRSSERSREVPPKVGHFEGALAGVGLKLREFGW